MSLNIAIRVGYPNLTVGKLFNNIPIAKCVEFVDCAVAVPVGNDRSRWYVYSNLCCEVGRGRAYTSSQGIPRGIAIGKLTAGRDAIPVYSTVCTFYNLGIVVINVCFSGHSAVSHFIGRGDCKQ